MAVNKAVSKFLKHVCSGKQIMLKQVCAVGKPPTAIEDAIWKLGLSSAKPPGGSCELPVQNCSNLAICSGVKAPSASQNHSRVVGESAPYT